MNLYITISQYDNSVYLVTINQVKGTTSNPAFIESTTAYNTRQALFKGLKSLIAYQPKSKEQE